RCDVRTLYRAINHIPIQERLPLMRHRSLLLGGLLAGLTFVGTVLSLAAKVPGYSHARQTVSEIGMHGSPVATPFAVGLLLTATLLLMFAVGLHGYGREIAV